MVKVFIWVIVLAGWILASLSGAPWLRRPLLQITITPGGILYAGDALITLFVGVWLFVRFAPWDEPGEWWK